MPMRAYPALLAVAATVTAAHPALAAVLARLNAATEAFQPQLPLLGRGNAAEGTVAREILMTDESLGQKPVRDVQLDGFAGTSRDRLKRVDVARIFSSWIGHGGLHGGKQILACQ